MENSVFLALGHDFDLPKMNYWKIYFYYVCNRPKRDLQNNIVNVYIII